MQYQTIALSSRMPAVRYTLLFAGCFVVTFAPTLATADERVAAFLANYCVDCHGAATQKGERRFDQLDLAAEQEDSLFDIQDIIDQLTLGEMPPEESAQPPVPERQALIDALTKALAVTRAKLDSTGRQTVLRRLNRREYLNTIGDLFEMDMSMFDPTTKFPRDNTADQLDNVGDVLVTSGYLLEQYLIAADEIVEKAFALQQPPDEQSWTFKDRFPQQSELDAAHREAFDSRYLCLYDCPEAERAEGAYGPLADFLEGVPSDGIYEIRVLAQAMNRDSPYDREILRIDLDEPLRLGIVPGNAAVGEMHRVQPIQPLLAESPITDGDPEWYSFRVPLDRGYSPRFTFENGMVEVRPTYARVVRQHRDLLPEELRQATGIVQHRKALIKAGYLPHIRIHEVQIRGPIDVVWPPRTQRAVLGEEPFVAERTRELLTRFATRAYRRPPEPGEIDRLMVLVDARVENGQTPLDGFKDGLKAVLCSPAFLYLQPPDMTPATDRASNRLSAYGVASRLSYFLWGSMPDEELMRLADSGELLDPDRLRAEVRRLLADDRSHAFIDGFLDSWLNLRALGDMPPDRNAFEAYYANGLETDMRTETRLFMAHLIEQDASVLEFLRADYSFLNRDLAKLYGVEDRVSPEDGHRFRQVTFDDATRGGLLGQASVLTVSANGIETSPVIRGVWMLENVLGTPPAPPPDDVPAIDPDVRGATSMRDLLEKHRSSPACNDCHRRIDPLGFALENFDPIGRWRERYENKSKIDSSGQLPSGHTFEDVVGLKEVLLGRKEFFARMLTEKLLAYGLGRRVELADRAEIDGIMEQVASDNYPMRNLIESVVVSEAFGRP